MLGAFLGNPLIGLGALATGLTLTATSYYLRPRPAEEDDQEEEDGVVNQNNADAAHNAPENQQAYIMPDQIELRAVDRPEVLRKVCEFCNTVCQLYRDYNPDAVMSEDFRGRILAAIHNKFYCLHRLEGLLPEGNAPLVNQLEKMASYLETHANLRGVGLGKLPVARPGPGLATRFDFPEPPQEQNPAPPPVVHRQLSQQEREQQQQAQQAAIAINYAGQVYQALDREQQEAGEGQQQDSLRQQARQAIHLFHQLPEESLHNAVGGEQSDSLREALELIRQLKEAEQQGFLAEGRQQVSLPHVQHQVLHSRQIYPPPCGPLLPVDRVMLPSVLDQKLQNCQIRCIAPSGNSGYVAFAAALLHHIVQQTNESGGELIQLLKGTISDPEFQEFAGQCRKHEDIPAARALLNQLEIDNSPQYLDRLLQDHHRLLPLVSCLRMLAGFKICNRNPTPEYTRQLTDSLDANQLWDQLIEYTGKSGKSLIRNIDIVNAYGCMIAEIPELSIAKPELHCLCCLLPGVDISVCEYDSRLPEAQQEPVQLPDGHCNLLLLKEDGGSHYSVLLPAAAGVAAIPEPGLPEAAMDRLENYRHTANYSQPFPWRSILKN